MNLLLRIYMKQKQQYQFTSIKKEVYNSLLIASQKLHLPTT